MRGNAQLDGRPLAGADWSRKTALALMDEAAHFWESPMGSISDCGRDSGFGKFLENDLPNDEKSLISDDPTNFMNIFAKNFVLRL